METGDDRQISDYVGAEVTWAQRPPPFCSGVREGALMVSDVNGDLQSIAASSLASALPDGHRILFWKPEALGYSLWIYDRAQTGQPAFDGQLTNLDRACYLSTLPLCHCTRNGHPMEAKLPLLLQ